MESIKCVWYRVSSNDILPYYSNDNLNLLTAWYISADMQLFIVRFLILALISRYPAAKKKIFTSIILLTYIVPTLVTYLNGFPVFMLGSVEVSRNFFRGFNHFQWYHIPWYTNLGSYSVGMVAAFIYHEAKSRKINLDTSKIFKLFNYLHYPVLLGLLSSSFVVQTYEFNITSWGVAVYSALFKNLWGILIATTILGYLVKPDAVWRQILGCRLNQGLGKLNYSYFIAHLTTMKFVLGNTMELPFFSLRGLVSFHQILYFLHITISYYLFFIIF